MEKGIIIWAVFLVIFIAGMIVSRKMKKGINENGIETDVVVSRIIDDGAQDYIGCDVYVKYRTEDGSEVEGMLSNPRNDLEVGQQVRIKYHPKYVNNARLV